MESPPFTIPPQQIPQQQNSRKSNVNKLLIITVVFLFVVGISVASYFLGAKSGKSVTPTPTPQLLLTNPSYDIATNTPLPTPTVATDSARTKTPTPANTRTKILSTVSHLDGYRLSNEEGDHRTEIKVGRDNKSVARGFLTFELGSISQQANIQEAVIRLYQAEIIGNPYSVGGSIKVDHLTYGDSLDSSDYVMPALVSNIATLSTNTILDWKEVDVAGYVKDDLANARSTSQFRIHFTKEVTGGEKSGDFVFFEAYEDTLKSGNTPKLIVKYN